MGRKVSKRIPALGTAVPWVPWKYTKCMNARDLSRDDDYLSHLFIEKISSIGATPLLVHRMDPERVLPKTDTQAIYNIVQQVARSRQSAPLAIKQAVNTTFQIHSVLYFIRDYDQRQINAFATHASRYLELYMPNGSIEIAQTSRYSRITGKNELCILATRPMPAGFLIAELKGSMAELTEDEDRELRNPSRGIDGGRRDFSVIHSKQLKKNHLFLGPARFVNHDCDNNCELFRDGRYITFRTIKPIALGQELTAHYGEGYFGKNNRHCLCETCERRGKGGYTPQAEGNGHSSSHDDSDSDAENTSDSDVSTVISAASGQKEEVNLNERRTRRGVYRIIQDESDGSEDEFDDESVLDILLRDRNARLDDLASPAQATPELTSTRSCSPGAGAVLPPKRRGRPRKEDITPTSAPVEERASFKSVITTRGQKAREASTSSGISQGRCSSTLSEKSGISNLTQQLRSRRSTTVDISARAHSPPKTRGRPRKSEFFGTPQPVDSVLVLMKEDTAAPSTRGRSSVAASKLVEQEPSAKKKIPSGPSCMTCLNPLPAEDIEDATSIQTKLKGKGKGKQKAKAIEKECQRCTRHFAIWGAPWPQRIATPGSRSLTRENTPFDLVDNVTQASLSVVDMKLSAARLAQLRRIKELEAEAEAESESGSGKGRVGRLKRKRNDLEPDIESTDGQSSASKRQRGMQKGNSRGVKVKVELDEVSLHEPVRKTVDATGRKRAVEIEPASLTSPNRKRGRNNTANANEALVSSCSFMDDDGDDRRDKTFWPALPPLPPVGDGIKRTGLLNLRPNPTLVSRWRASPLRVAHSFDSTPPTLVDDDTDEATSDEHPATPENNVGATPEVVDTLDGRSVSSSDARDLPPTSDEEDEEDEESIIGNKKRTVSTLKGLGLISKPNPLVLSKRIWAPTALIVEPDCEDMEIPPSSEQPKIKRRRKDLENPDQHSTNSSTPTSPIERPTLSDLSINAFESRAKKGMFDDFDASSGEEDVIVPGPSNSKLYLLQKNAFSTPESVHTPPPASPAPDAEQPVAAVHPSPPHVSLTSSPSLAKILNPMVTLGPLHSEFIPESPVPIRSPSFVHAGWDSDLDSDYS